MKIKTEGVKELNYNELTALKENVECGDLIIIKAKDSDVWNAQFVTMITDLGIYIHSDSNKLDGGGIILWPESTKADVHKLYNGDKFIHIPMEKE